MRCSDTVREGRSLVSLTDWNEVRMMFLTFFDVMRVWYWVYTGGGGYVMFRKHVPNVVGFAFNQGRDKAKSQVTFGVGVAVELRIVSCDTMKDIEKSNGRLEIDLSYGYTLGSSSEKLILPSICRK